jgi:hypothetical protein
MGNFLSSMWSEDQKEREQTKGRLWKVMVVLAFCLALYVIFVKGSGSRLGGPGRSVATIPQTGGAPAHEDLDAILKDTNSFLERLGKADTGRSMSSIPDAGLPDMSPDVPDASTW